MALTKFNESVTNHQSLPDKPSLTSSQLKALFDKASVDIKTYINSTLTSEIDTKLSELTTKINSVYPVGAIYMSVNSTNPGTLFGGTWVAWGQGKVPVGFNINETEFNESEKTGGEKTHTLTTGELPSHNHGLNNHTHGIPSLSGTANSKSLIGTIWNMAVQSKSTGLGASGISSCNNPGGTVAYATESKQSSSTSFSDSVTINATHNHTVTTNAGTTGQASGNTANTGSGQAHNNLQPYITCYMWKRTA